MCPSVSYPNTDHCLPAKTLVRGLARMVNLLLLLLAGLTRMGCACRQVVGIFHRKAIIFVSTFRHQAFRFAPPRRTSVAMGLADKDLRTKYVPHLLPPIGEGLYPPDTLAMHVRKAVIHVRKLIIRAQDVVTCVQKAVIHVRRVVIHTLKTIIHVQKAACRKENTRPVGGLQTEYTIKHQRQQQEDLKPVGCLQTGYAINLTRFVGKTMHPATPIVAGLPTIGRSVSADAVPTLILSHTYPTLSTQFFRPTRCALHGE